MTDAATEVDIAEAPLVADMLRDEALHRDRLARISRLRELATKANQPERLLQIDELERRELQRHEARVVRDRSQLSERSARGVDSLVERGGVYRARGADITAARKQRAGSSGGSASRPEAAPARGPDRTAPRTTRPSSSPQRPPARAPSRSGGGGRSPR